MRKLIYVAVFCCVIGVNYAEAVDEGEYHYLWSQKEGLRGFESADYLYDKEGKLTAYKARSEHYTYIYTPDGDYVGYRPRKTMGDFLYVYDSDGRVQGWYDPGQVAEGQEGAAVFWREKASWADKKIIMP